MRNLMNPLSLVMRYSHCNHTGSGFARLIARKVEGEAQGDEQSLQKLLTDINKGPSAAHVVKVETSELSVKEGESSFEAD